MRLRIDVPVQSWEASLIHEYPWLTVCMHNDRRPPILYHGLGFFQWKGRVSRTAHASNEENLWGVPQKRFTRPHGEFQLNPQHQIFLSKTMPEPQGKEHYWMVIRKACEHPWMACKFSRPQFQTEVMVSFEVQTTKKSHLFISIPCWSYQRHMGAKDWYELL